MALDTDIYQPNALLRLMISAFAAHSRPEFVLKTIMHVTVINFVQWSVYQLPGMPDIALRYLVIDALILSTPFIMVGITLVTTLETVLEGTQRIARTDSLTGLPNRRAFFEAARAWSTGYAALIDVDHFKKINDSHGHDTGDACLRHIGQWLPDAMPKGALVCRYGGEEFAALLPEDDFAAFEQACAALGRGLEVAQAAEDGAQLSVTASVGVARWAPGQSLEEALRHADEALYVAKAQGRARLVMADAA